MAVLEVLHGSEAGTAGNELVRELGLVWLAIVDLLVVVAGLAWIEVSKDDEKADLRSLNSPNPNILKVGCGEEWVKRCA